MRSRARVSPPLPGMRTQFVHQQHPVKPAEPEEYACLFMHLALAVWNYEHRPSRRVVADEYDGTKKNTA